MVRVGIGGDTLAMVQIALRPQTECSPAPARTRAGTILLVEDEELVRTIIRISLTRDGYRVLEAPTPSAAARLWDEQGETIDLLIADLRLGDALPSGLEIAQRFQRNKRRLRVLITSGQSVAELDAPFPCHFLQKPFDLGQLATTVRRVFADARAETGDV